MKKQSPPVAVIRAPAFVRMFLVGLLLGAAVIWYLWRQRSQTPVASGQHPAPTHGPEIDITYARRLHPDTTPLVKETAKEEAPAKPAQVKAPADFTIIKGIGPVYAQRLQDAGIINFADLAKQAPQHLRAVVQAKEWQALDIESWILQARALAD